MNYLLLTPTKDLIGIFETNDIKAAKQVIRNKYPFGTHFAAYTTAEIAELKTNAGKFGRKTATLQSDTIIKQIQL